VITGFSDQGTEDIFHGFNTKAARKSLPRDLWGIARRKLDMIDAALDVLDLRSPPGNMLEKLKGTLAGKFSIRINDQFRIVFAFANGNASEVEITDYH
jgi:proteic killer suppression protein